MRGALELDLPTYLRLPMPSREALDEWMRFHGIDPCVTRALRFGEGVTNAHQIVARRIPVEYLWTTHVTSTPPPRHVMAEVMAMQTTPL